MRKPENISVGKGLDVIPPGVGIPEQCITSVASMKLSNGVKLGFKIFSRPSDVCVYREIEG